MTEERGQLQELPRGIDAGLVPVEQRRHREAVPQVVDPGRRTAFGRTNAGRAAQAREDAAHRIGAEGSAAHAGEDCCVVRRPAPTPHRDIRLELLREPRTERHQAVLAELGAPHDERPGTKVHVAELKAGDFANAKAKAVEDRERHSVCRGRQRTDSWPISEPCRGVEKLAHLGIGEEHRSPTAGFASRVAAVSDDARDSLDGHPVQEAADRALEMVVAPGAASRPRGQEFVDDAGRDLADLRQPLRGNEAVKQSKRPLFDGEAHSERALRGQVRLDVRAKRAAVARPSHELALHSAASPRARATSRSFSTETLL